MNPDEAYPSRWRRGLARGRRALAKSVTAFAGLLRPVSDGDEPPMADLRSAFADVRPRRVVVVIVVAGLLAYLLTGTYIVAPGEAAVVRRFGAVVVSRAEPGLHYRIPWPVERVDIVNVSAVRRETVGVLAPEEDHVHPEPPSKLQALSGDTNVVDVEIIVQYQVRDPSAYLFNVRYAPYRLVRDILRRSVTAVVTTRPVDALLTTGRRALQIAIQTETQARLDAYGSGLAVIGVDLQKAFPPDEVADAFTAVNTAREERARSINEARGYANSLVPEARGRARGILAEGRSYEADTLARAEGEARAFEAVLATYRDNTRIYGEAVTRYRLYLETMDEVLPRVRIYAVDIAKGGNVNLRLFGPAIADSEATGNARR